MTAGLHGYRFDKNALRFVYNYLKERKQKLKIQNEYSKLQKILFGVEKGSILGPLLFDIVLWDLLFYCDRDEKEMLKNMSEIRKLQRTRLPYLRKVEKGKQFTEEKWMSF